MPNVLLIGGSVALYEMLRKDSRWNVLRAMHGEKASGSVLGDPRKWHLVIDDCAHAQIAAAEADALVSDDYLREATRARGVVLCQSQHDEWWAVAPSGHHDFEANPTEAPEAIHLVDFFDEFGEAFVNRYLSSHSQRFEQKETQLISNSYGRPLAVLQREIILPTRLILIDLADDAARLKAFEYLLYRTVPKLWPEVCSDQFRPRRVAELEHLREREIAGRRARVAEIDTAIDAELAYYAAYAPLTLLADDPLKALVARAFAEVFACEVIDLDEELEAGEPKTLDLLVRRPGWCGFVEVRARGTRAARVEDIDRLDNHVEAVEARHGPPDSKVFIFNGMYWRGPESRSDDILFSQQVVEEARTRAVALLSTSRLLQAIEVRRNGEMTDAQFIEPLGTPGVFQPPWK